MRPKIGAEAPTVKPAPPRKRGRNGRKAPARLLARNPVIAETV